MLFNTLLYDCDIIGAEDNFLIFTVTTRREVGGSLHILIAMRKKEEKLKEDSLSQRR
jgi:hypothetical protein